jgi:excisionase family DNA binding protein
MKDYADVYLTPEQVAEELQLVVDTVYRWLRSGKLRGSRISHKAWRISKQELSSFMKRQNVSELFFEAYLADHNLGQPDHEPPYPGTTMRVDYRLPYHGQTLWFEVKEFEEKAGSDGAFDPYKEIRQKINKAVAKFRDYDGECCSLVLFNEQFNLVDIQTPRIVLGAMHGDVGFSIPINLETMEEAGPSTTIFGRGRKFGPQYNTTISAVIALERLAIGRREFLIAVEKENREMSWEELTELQKSNEDRYSRRVLCVSVYENPHAANPLPGDIFVGPFDQRWGYSAGVIKPVYIGSELETLLNTEHELELDLNPFQRHLKKEKRQSN